MSISRSILALLVIVSSSRPGWSTPTDETSEMLARAEALYYEADFEKSIELLSRADQLLQQQSGHLEDKINVKLQLALGFIGLNDSDRAKSYLVQLYALDADHRIDPQIFAPKVVRLAEEARIEQFELHCRSLLDEAQKDLGAGNSDPVVKLIGSSRTKCPGLAALSPKVAELVFKEGLAAYKKAQLTEALQNFRSALVLEPENDLAAQYLELTESKMELTASKQSMAVDRTIIAWHNDFNAGDFALAARDYRELASLNSLPEIDNIRGEYRQALASRADLWSRACATNDVAAMDRIRAQVNALLPEPSFGEDILAKMKTCTPASCIQMDSQSALARLKTRVDPQFPAQVLSKVKNLPVTVNVKARIDVNGNVASSDARGGDPLLYNAIRTAVDKWKFLPAGTEGGDRCVDTEIPIFIHYAN